MMRFKNLIALSLTLLSMSVLAAPPNVLIRFGSPLS